MEIERIIWLALVGIGIAFSIWQWYEADAERRVARVATHDRDIARHAEFIAREEIERTTILLQETDETVSKLRATNGRLTSEKASLMAQIEALAMSDPDDCATTVFTRDIGDEDKA